MRRGGFLKKGWDRTNPRHHGPARPLGGAPPPRGPRRMPVGTVLARWLAKHVAKSRKVCVRKSSHRSVVGRTEPNPRNTAIFLEASHRRAPANQLPVHRPLAVVQLPDDRGSLPETVGTRQDESCDIIRRLMRPFVPGRPVVAGWPRGMGPAKEAVPVARRGGTLRSPARRPARTAPAGK
jgi:hypothetical protein